jgi:hypothetical protein
VVAMLLLLAPRLEFAGGGEFVSESSSGRC